MAHEVEEAARAGLEAERERFGRCGGVRRRVTDFGATDEVEEEEEAAEGENNLPLTASVWPCCPALAGGGGAGNLAQTR